MKKILFYQLNESFKNTLENEERVVLKIHPALAPYKVTILPLIKKVHADKANDVYAVLCKYFACSYDESGSIGKRYRRSDAIGTPLCITIDDETLNKGVVTVRDRDTMEQITLNVDELVDYINKKIEL